MLGPRFSSTGSGHPHCTTRGAVQCSGAPVGRKVLWGHGTSMAPHRAFHGTTRGPVQRWPSPMGAQSNGGPSPITPQGPLLHTPHGPLYHHEGGTPRAPRVPSPLPLPGHAGLLAPHICPGTTDAQAPPMPIGRVHTAAASHCFMCVHTHNDPNGPPAPPSDFTTAYSPSLRPPPQSQ